MLCKFFCHFIIIVSVHFSKNIGEFQNAISRSSCYNFGPTRLYRECALMHEFTYPSIDFYGLNQDYIFVLSSISAAEEKKIINILIPISAYFN